MGISVLQTKPIISMKIKYMFFVSVFLCLGFCVVILDFVKEVRNDLRKSMQSHKSFIKSIELEGVVLDKELCIDCVYNKYQLIIELNEFDLEKIEFNDLAFPPYYNIYSNKINLSISHMIYENVEIGDNILKRRGSDIIKIKGKDFLLLNNSKYIWLPQQR